MSTAQLTITKIFDREHYDDQTATEALHQRVKRLRDARTPVTITGTTVTYEQRRDTWTERTTIDYRDDEIPGQVDALELIGGAG